MVIAEKSSPGSKVGQYSLHVAGTGPGQEYGTGERVFRHAPVTVLAVVARARGGRGLTTRVGRASIVCLLPAAAVIAWAGSGTGPKPVRPVRGGTQVPAHVSVYPPPGEEVRDREGCVGGDGEDEAVHGREELHLWGGAGFKAVA